MDGTEREIEEHMARTNQNQRPAGPRPELSGGRAPSRLSVLILSASVLAIFWALAMLTPAGRIAYVYAFFFMDFFGGVFALVALSLTVMIGLLATDRIVLLPRHRVLLQSAHRTTGIMSITFLVLHIVTQISTGMVSTVGAFIPFLGGGQAIYVGFGTVAAYLMFAILWTGLARVRFVGVGPPWMWRALHSGAYVAWPIGIMHGLGAGRPPATWVTLSYLGCALLVVIALLVRFATGVGKKKPFVSQATGTSMKPVGKMADDSRSRSGSARRRGGRADGVGLEPVTARFGQLGDRAADMIDSWVPAAAKRSTSPGSADRYRVPEVPRPSPRPRPAAEATREYRRLDDDRDGSRTDTARRRYADEDTRRYRDDDTVSGRRYAAEPDGGGRRRYVDDDRGYDDGYDGRPSPDEAVGSRGRFADDRPVSGAGARSRFADDRPVSGAGPRGRFDDRPVSSEPARTRASRHRSQPAPEPLPPAGADLEDDYLPPDDTPTLVDLASRRARRAAATDSAGRRSRRRQNSDDDYDEEYWTQLRGEAN
ncbi:ferric reductase-like transmembrane domain-containing protein [Solwaraspora sp. WMMB335]|uniref:ferric reductase-like transmembrane domain-containing protein n=1 Tax=Solwaraspora sp. WMMB335 TaxID=3404118 RepID=UPI003B955979